MPPAEDMRRAPKVEERVDLPADFLNDLPEYKCKSKRKNGVFKGSKGPAQVKVKLEKTNLTLKQETTKPAAFNFLQQQERFDDFIEVYNNERPHQALGGAYPGDVYTPSVREYRPPDEPEYPYHDRTIRVTRCGRICIAKRKINFSTVFAGQLVGIREVEDQIWLVSFMDYDLGYFDNERGRVEPGPNPFVPDKVLTMCPE